MISDASLPGANGGPDDDEFELDQMSEAEKETLVNSLLDELRELYHGYVAGQYPFEEVTFETFDTLQTLHALATGSLLIEYVDEDDEFDEFDELAGEPTNTGNGNGGQNADTSTGKSKSKSKNKNTGKDTRRGRN
jgi:hypothetical protein